MSAVSVVWALVLGAVVVVAAMLTALALAPLVLVWLGALASRNARLTKWAEARLERLAWWDTL